MAEGAHARFIVEAGLVPILPGAHELARQDAFPGGSRSNVTYFSPHIENRSHLSAPHVALLCDAVTSGGLLFTADPRQRNPLEQRAKEMALALYRIGRVEEGSPAVVLID
jgi:selenide,water dikinase